MTNSKYLAGLVGPTLIALGLSEMMNPHICVALIAPVTWQGGTLGFVAGLAIVRAHNQWTLGWPVMVTLVGWFALHGGLGRMFFPEAVQQGIQNASAADLAWQIILLAIGIFLNFKAYSRE